MFPTLLEFRTSERTMAKLYKSKEWLFYMRHNKKLTPVEIAKIAGVSHQTIYNKLKEFGID